MLDQKTVKDTQSITSDTDIFTELSSGQKVAIYKAKVKHIGPIFDLLSFVLKELNIDSMKGVDEKTLNNPSFIMQTIAMSLPKITPVAAQLCSLSEEEFIELDLDDAVTIVTKEVEINKSFFLKSILPKIKSLSI